MQQIREFIDERYLGVCAHCSAPADEGDHVPAKVFLDPPYPENLPVAASCSRCNRGPSLDEQYAACALEVLACGTANPDGFQRSKIARTLRRSAPLAARLSQAFDETTGTLTVEMARLQSVLEKAARGLWRCEAGESAADLRAATSLLPVWAITADQWAAFTRVPLSDFLPEVGSRGMVRTLVGDGIAWSDPWQVVQPVRFEYAVEVGTGRVKMLVRDVLVIEVAFSP